MKRMREKEQRGHEINMAFKMERGQSDIELQ